jgi:hypothetical protein
MILDLLDDDAFFEEKRFKCKTEFVRRERERQESNDSNNDEVALPGDA